MCLHLVKLLTASAVVAMVSGTPQAPPNCMPTSTPQSTSSPPSTPLSKEEFTLAMRIPWLHEEGATQAALAATKNGSGSDLLLVAQQQVAGFAASPGTPVYTTNTEPRDRNGFDYVSLNLDVNGTLYGLFAADVGSVYGIATIVLAVEARQQEEWSVGESLFHKMAAANNLLLACNRTVNGEPAVVLGWGIYYSNGSAPAGCMITSVSKECNVAGSSATCTESTTGD